MSNFELWTRAEFRAGHEAGAEWWNAACVGPEDEKPPCPYDDTERRALWERGFEWGESDAENSFYQTGAI